ncbi:hypothetical protein BGZ83_003438 [Gryganskiella cystojenkinii]|nr:hypothetical protein BGZ83_003438 [Gryganskiella cystojenkinii]
MVFVNGQKFACATCIKGHRSTSCNHSDRPLHEIKKKGRPTTQCPHCKDLRKAKQVQVRCRCSHQDDALSSNDTPGHPGMPGSSTGVSTDCGCFSGAVCTCCRDREGHVVVKPGKSPTRAGIFRNYKVKPYRGTSSLDPNNLLQETQETSPHSNGSGHNNYKPFGDYGSSSSYSPLTSSNPSTTTSPLTTTTSEVCFDYASSSEYDSDSYNPSATSAPNRTQGYLSAVTMDHGIPLTLAFPNQPFIPTITPTSASTATKSCCKSEQPAAPALPTVGNCSSNVADTGMTGCGCSISASMCCCGELCACPGCLAYPSNENVLNAVFDPLGTSSSVGDSCSNKSAPILASTTVVSQSKGSCCGSRKSDSVNAGDPSTLTIAQALNLIGASGDRDSGSRQALRQTLSDRGLSGLDSMKMQHPTVVSETGVLICGCGCGRPTVDCVDCFRDMCAFVGESQAKMLKDELDFEMAMNEDGGYLADVGLNKNMSRLSHVPISTSKSLGLDMDIGDLVMEEDSLLQVTSDLVSPFGPDQAREREERLRQQLMEQEQFQLSQMQQLSGIDPLQLDFLDDADWSFVDEIRTDGVDHLMSGVEQT